MRYVKMDGSLLYSQGVNVVKDTLDFNYCTDINDIPFGNTGITQNFNSSNSADMISTLELMTADVLNNNNKYLDGVRLNKIVRSTTEPNKFDLEFKYKSNITKVEVIV